MKKALCIIIVCAVMLGLWFWRPTQPTVAAVLPEKSVFFIDKEFSAIFKNDLTSAIALAYAQSKNPQVVIHDATVNFPEILSMQVQICQTDKICFYVDGAHPLFLLNDTWIVCDNGSQVAKDHFRQEVVAALVKINSLQVAHVDTMIHFIQKLPDWFKQRFFIDWCSDTDIKMYPIQSGLVVLQVSADAIPSEQDVADCLLIGDQHLKKSKNKKKSMMYDVRFKNQIIVR